jgi:hypothetical protein
MHIHTLIDKLDQKAPAKRVQFVLRADRIQSGDNDIAQFQGVSGGLPVRPDGMDMGTRTDAQDKTLGDFNLVGFTRYIDPGPAYQPIQIGILDDVGIDQHKRANADMGQLLSDMGTAAAQPNDADGRVCQYCVAISTQETLSV